MLLGMAALALLGACDIPSSSPLVDTRWTVPAPSTTISVGSLLPSGVTILADSSGFAVAVDPVSVIRALSQDCSACASANGLTVPKPAFTAQASAGTALPSDIASATLTAGTLAIALRNNYNFDPLRPSSTARGFVVFTVSSGATQLGRDSVNGATLALPPGGTLTRVIPLAGTVTGSAPVTVTVKLDSPAGDSVQMDASRTIGATATPSGIVVASASVVVAGRQVSATSTIDLSQVDSSVINHVESGSLLLDVANPFGVTGTLAVRFSAPGITPIDKSVPLAADSSSPSIAFTSAELRQLFGHLVTITFSGPVSAAAPVTVSPKQAVVVTSHLDVNVRIGETTS
ncbi:MAG: hypothetical protein JWN53_280 [Gemmatimonadetes bacterium]|nr:hypothetical protein [Gemmatimonadota bacterium]